jgi:hypothetical protein
MRVAILRSLDRVKTAEGWESVTRGQEATFPFWLAARLQEKGLVEIRENLVTPEDLSKSLMVEKGLSRGVLSKLRESFYYEARDVLNKVKEEGDREPSKLLTIMRIEADFYDLARLRLMKLISMASLGGSPEKVTENMLVEERVLFNALKRHIEGWFNEVVGDGRRD